jgi:beta-lactamase regulating signal transducer with metallopeptidase domain
MNGMIEQLNTMGQGFVSFSTLMIFESAALIGLVLLAEHVLRRNVRAALRYWLVTLVLAYLLVTPFLPICPPSNFMPAGSAAYADPTTHLAAEHARAPLSQPTTGQSQTTTVGTGEPPRRLSWQGVVLLLWVVGVIVMSGVVVRRAATACKCVGDSPTANLLMNDILLYCRKRMRIKRPVQLRVCDEGAQPTVCGLFSPVILVPRDLAPTLGSRHLRAVLLHQLAHVKRHDLWVNVFQSVVQVLYFYNPFLWLANAVIRRLRDEAADEAVLDTVGEEDGIYAQRLADVAGMTFRRSTPSLDLVAIA